MKLESYILKCYDYQDIRTWLKQEHDVDIEWDFWLNVIGEDKIIDGAIYDINMGDYLECPSHYDCSVDDLLAIDLIVKEAGSRIGVYIYW